MSIWTTKTLTAQGQHSNSVWRHNSLEASFQARGVVRRERNGQEPKAIGLVDMRLGISELLGGRCPMIRNLEWDMSMSNEVVCAGGGLERG